MATSLSTPSPPSTPPASTPSLASFVLAYLLIGLAWGFTTPFIRRGARLHVPPPHPILSSPAVSGSPWKGRVLGWMFGVWDLLRDWRYAMPLVLNLTGSVWFFLVVGKAGEFCVFIGWFFLCLWRFRCLEGLRFKDWKLMLMIWVFTELSLTVPITNSLAFLFTVLGEWVVERKVIGRGRVL